MRSGLCDKYSMDGEFIGSFVIQDNCVEITYDKGGIPVANPLDTSARIYEFERFTGSLDLIILLDKCLEIVIDGNDLLTENPLENSIRGYGVK